MNFESGIAPKALPMTHQLFAPLREPSEKKTQHSKLITQNFFRAQHP
ncbi:conserved hypothetical protein [delta proteobacterium NaphS2]|nr:conserved hypothetical protein [delta proteobacterium NaphS2]